MTLMLPPGMNLIVRTDFTDEPGWRALLEAVAQPPAWASEVGDGDNDPDIWDAIFSPINDPQFSGVEWQAVQAAVPPIDEATAMVFIADTVTFSRQEQPLLVVDLSDYHNRARPPFRCLPATLHEIEANLNLANMDWEDFADSTDPDGIFSGFPE